MAWKSMHKVIIHISYKVLLPIFIKKGNTIGIFPFVQVISYRAHGVLLKISFIRLSTSYGQIWYQYLLLTKDSFWAFEQFYHHVTETIETTKLFDIVALIRFRVLSRWSIFSPTSPVAVLTTLRSLRPTNMLGLSLILVTKYYPTFNHERVVPGRTAFVNSDSL